MKLTIRKRMIEHIPILEVAPEDKINEALPLIVYYHGWQTKKELALTAGKKIALKNMRVIIPDGMYHGERLLSNPTKIPSFRFWSTIQHNLSEFSLIKDYFEERHLVKDDLLGVAGFSMGGMTTAGILTHFPEVKAAAILMGAPNFQDFIHRVTTYMTKENIYHVPVLKDLLTWTTNYDLNLMPEKIDGRPLYFWHGTEDAKLPYEVTHQFYLDSIHTDYGKNMRFDTGVGEPHILTIDIMNRTADFFEKEFTN